MYVRSILIYELCVEMCNVLYEKLCNLWIECFFIFCFCFKIWGNVWICYVLCYFVGRFFFYLEIIFYKSFGINYKIRNLIGKMRLFRIDWFIIDIWFFCEIVYFFVFFYGNVYFFFFSGFLGYLVVWLIMSWCIIKSYFVVIRFFWILFFKFY